MEQPSVAPPLKSVITMACASGLLFIGYESIRSSTNSLFKAAFGVDQLATAMALIPAVLLPLLVFYNKVLSAFGPRHTLTLSGILSGLCIFGCYIGISMESRLANWMLFLLREAYIVLMVEQMWSFINSILTQSDAKKYNGLFLTISSSGAVLGGVFVHFAAEHIGTTNLILLAVLLFIPILCLTNFAYALPHKPVVKPAKEKKTDLLGFGLFTEHKVLFMILFMIIASQIYATVVTINFQEFLEKAYPTVDKQTSISGLFFATLNVVSISLQLIVAPLLLSRVPLNLIMVGIPLCNFLASSFAMIRPNFWTAAIAMLLFKSVDYSLFRAAKEVLYIPLPFDARFRAKELIDVFGYRLSKSGTSVVISALQALGAAFTTITYLWIGLASAGLWLSLVLPLARMYLRVDDSKARVVS